MADPLGVIPDSPPPQGEAGPSRRRREPADLHERMILAQRQKNRERATRAREERRTAPSPTPGASSSTTPTATPVPSHPQPPPPQPATQTHSQPPPLPPYPPQLSPRVPPRPPPPRARAPAPDPYARNTQGGRLFDPANDPIPTAPVASTSGQATTSQGISQAQASVQAHGRPLPALPSHGSIQRGYPPTPQHQPQPSSPLLGMGASPPSAVPPPHPHPQPHAPQPPQHAPHQPGRQLFDPSRDNPFRFSVLNRAHAAPSLPQSSAVAAAAAGPSGSTPGQATAASLPPTTSASASTPMQGSTPRNAVLSGISNGTSSSLSQSLVGSSGTGTTGSAVPSTPATSNYVAGAGMPQVAGGGMVALPPGVLGMQQPKPPGVLPLPHPPHVPHAPPQATSTYSGQSGGSAPYTSASSNASTESSIHLSAPIASQRSGETGRNVLVERMKKLYESITTRERDCERVLARVEELLDAGLSRDVGRKETGRDAVTYDREEMEMERRWWFSVVDYHEELADTHHAMVRVAVHPLTGGALERVIARYNLPTRLWSHVWHLLRVLVDRARSPNPAPLPTSLTKEPISTFRGRLTPEQISAMSPFARPNPPKRPHSTHLHLTPRLIAAELVDVAFAWAWELYAVLWEQRTVVHADQINLGVCWSEAMGDLARFRSVWAKETEGNADARNALVPASDAGSVSSRSAFSAQSARDHREEDNADADGDVDMDEGDEDDRMSLDGSSGRPLAQPQPRFAQQLVSRHGRHHQRGSSHLQRLATPNAASASHRPFPPHQSPALAPSHQPPNAPNNHPGSPAGPLMIPSIGMAAVALWGPIRDTEVWRNVAQEWYWRGLSEMPGVGRLQHHLGLLAQAAQADGASALEGGETRVVYHFLKSLTTSQPHVTARESVLPLFSVDKQRARAAPDASTSALFVLLHGILYTRVQLDDFAPTKARFDERLRLELADIDTAGNVSESEWIMWGVMCLAACAEYGKEDGIIKKAEGRLRKTDKEDADEDMDDVVDGVAALTAETADSDEPFPLTFRLALQLTFDLLAIVLEHPYHRAPPYYTPHLNPFIVMMFTYLSTIAKSHRATAIVERYVPWEQLARFVQGHVQRVSQGDRERAAKLRAEKPNSGGILPEDWALRGMEWVTRRVYQKGFWDKKPPKPEIVYDARGQPMIKGGAHELVTGEADVLALGIEPPPLSTSATVSELVRDGIVEDEGASMRDAWVDLAKRRWKRVMGASAMLEKRIRGWQWEDGRGWVVGGELGDKLAAWREEDERERREREEEERRLRNRVWDDELQGDQRISAAEPEEEVDGDVDEVVKALLVQRTTLREQLDSQRTLSTRGARPPSYPPVSRPSKPASQPRVRRDLQVLRGYTILVLDTNILITSLLGVQNLIEGMRWTVVIPLPVLAELDGLRSHPDLSDMATLALEYIKSHVRSHAKSLKVQTSKGNYLSNLAVTTEVLDFSGAARNIDGLILDAVAWQVEHFVDRSAILVPDDEMVSEPTEQTSKVVLLTFDRNMRLRARSRQLDVASPNEVAAILLSD